MQARRVRDIEYQLLPGVDRKTTDIVIERNGTIVVRPPKDLSPEQIDSIVESKRLWIYRNLAEWLDLNAAAVVREWVNGETFLYLGRSYRLALISNADFNLKLKDGRFYLNRSIVDEKGFDAAKKVFEDFYCNKGFQHINARVNYFAPKVGVKPVSVTVKEIGYQWASCSSTNSLNFHWKCMMAPSKIVDYVIVHELCHIRTKNHSDVFWNEVDKVMPDYRERKEWLKLNGASLDL